MVIGFMYFDVLYICHMSCVVINDLHVNHANINHAIVNHANHLAQSFTPYRTAQRPIVKSVNYGTYIQVGVWML